MVAGDSDSSSISEDWDMRDRRTSVRTHFARSHTHIPAHLTDSQTMAAGVALTFK